MKITALVAVFAASLALSNVASADVIVAQEDFDGGALNLSGMQNVGPFPGAGGDFQNVFGVVLGANQGGGGMPRAVADDTIASVSGSGVSPGDSLGIAGSATGTFFAMDNPDQVNNNAVWSFDISSSPGLTRVQMDLAAMGNFNNGQGFLVEAQIDTGGYQSIFQASPDTSTSGFQYRVMDGGAAFSYDNPLQVFIDGSSTAAGFLNKSDSLSGRFDTYESVLFAGQTGSTMDIRLSWTHPTNNPAGGKPSGMDNIVIRGVPEPASCAILGFMALGVAIGRRRKK